MNILSIEMVVTEKNKFDHALIVNSASIVLMNMFRNIYSIENKYSLETARYTLHNELKKSIGYENEVVIKLLGGESFRSILLKCVDRIVWSVNMSDRGTNIKRNSLSYEAYSDSSLICQDPSKYSIDELNWRGAIARPGLRRYPKSKTFPISTIERYAQKLEEINSIRTISN